MDKEKRFWVYSHDAEGDIVDDLGNVDTLEEAVRLALWAVEGFDTINITLTYRVVDNDLQNGTTVWWAGPKVNDHG